uniref:Somatostatin/Cortistatin C-terminal domain-containing protein n=1 Tax=Lates calcarifer TaxID=8187 RepID=A0A4W6E504_LATCA
MAYIFCILALLCFASCVAGNTETDQVFKDLQLQQDTLSSPNKLEDKQESMKTQGFVDLLYNFFKSKNGIILQGPKDTEKRGKNRRGLTTRRPGCLVFFWKTWAAC